MKHNRIHQRALALLLSFTLVFSIVHMAGISAFSAESGGVTAYYNDAGLFKDSACTQAVDPDSDYDYLNTITQVVVKDSTSAIGECAFENCSSLQTVTFETGSQLASIGDYAFYCCDQLTEITIPDGVTSIGASAFYETALTEVTLPDSVTSIGDDAFYECNRLRTVIFGAGSHLTSIGQDAFTYCSKLSGITIPDSVTSIGESAFADCIAMQAITVGANNTHYSSDGVSLFSQNKTELIAYSAGKTGSYQVPDSVTTIDGYAFYGSGLTGISFGTGSCLASVGNSAFSNCLNLTVLTLPNSVNTIDEDVFSGCINLKSMVLPENLQSINHGLFENCSSLTSVTIPKNTTFIPPNPSYNIFSGCDSLKEVNVEPGNANYRSYDGVLYTSGTDEALTLNFCPSAKEGVCTVKAGTTAIGEYAFNDCHKLTGITLPEGLTTIGNAAFQSCTGLTRIDLPESVTAANWYLFHGCTGLKALTVSANTNWENLPPDFLAGGNLYVVKNAEDTDNSFPCGNKFYFTKSADGSTYQFQSYTGTKVGAVIPTELYGKPISPAIQDSAITATPLTVYYNGSGFYLDSAYQNPVTQVHPCAVTNVVIGDNVTELDEDIFYGLSSLTEITIPARVTRIDPGAFSGCSSLQNITVSPDNPRYCSKGGVLYQKESSNKLSLVFCPITRTGNLEISADTDTIGDSAFQGCTGLTNVTIPAGVTSIGEDAFINCAGLTSVTIPSGVTSIGEDAFENCTDLTNVTIPAGVTEIGNYTFENCTALTSVAFPSELTNIGSGAFMGCTSLTNITIPSGVTEIHDAAFENCASLNTVVLEGTATTLDDDAFNLHEGLLGMLALTQQANSENNSDTNPGQSDSSLTVYVPQESLDFYNDMFDSDVLDSTVAEIKAIPIISAFDTPSPFIAPKGAALSNLSMPQTILATVNGVPHTEVDGVTWNADRTYDPNATGTYSFTAVLPFYCRTAQNLSMPKLSVHVVETGKSILKFTIGSSAGRIDETAHTVVVTVPYGTDVTKLAPVITVSSGATVSPASGILQDFTKPVIYTVTAQNGGKQAYTVTVTEALAPSPNHSSTTSTVALPSGVTDTVSNAQADLSGATMPSGVTSVILSVTPETVNPTTGTTGEASTAPGAVGGASDPQAAAVLHLIVSDPGLNIIGTPVLYNIKLLDQNGNPITGFSGKVTVRIPVPAGLHGTPHVFRYEESTGTLTDMNAVVENGFLVFSTEHFSYYTVAGVGDSVTLDTKGYSMPVGGKYQIGVKLTGAKAASVKIASTNDKVASVVRLKNGNVSVTGKGTGTAYIMIDVYDSKNHLLTHASVRIDVKTGIRPRGDSTRQIGVF